MNISLLKKAAIQSLALMIIVITSSYALKQYRLVTIAASSQNNDTGSASDLSMEVTVIPTLSPMPVQAVQEELTGAAAVKSGINPEVLSQLGDNFLMIKKPMGNALSLSLEDIYINKSIQLDLTGMTDNDLTSDMITRIRGNDMFSGDPEYTEITSTQVNEDDGTTEEVVTKDFGRDLSQGIEISVSGDTAAARYTAKIRIILDSVYAYSIFEDKDYYYISLKKPSQVYDRILVIDAGHGGKDAGALSKNEEYYEKNINLGILLELKRLLDKENIKVYYTRTADDQVYLRPRAALANAVDADYFISIHSNANKVTSPNGFEVLYYNNEFKGVKDKDLASLFSQELGKLVTLKQKGIVQKNFNDIYIMDQSLVPTILIEMGYMSNTNDLNYLNKEENRKTIAQGMFNAIMRAYEELPSKRSN